MTPDEKLRHWEDTFRGMGLYPFMVHDPFALLQIAHPGDQASLARSIWQLGEKLKAYAVEMLEEAGQLKQAMMAASGTPFPPQAPEYAQPPAQAVPAAPAPQFPPSARRARMAPAVASAVAAPPGVVEVAGDGPSFSFLAPPDGGPKPKPSIA